MNDETLREALEQWVVRTTPWTGIASMTAEEGYNAAIEEVVAMLNSVAAPAPAPTVDAAGLDEDLLATAIWTVLYPDPAAREATLNVRGIAEEYDRLAALRASAPGDEGAKL